MVIKNFSRILEGGSDSRTFVRQKNEKFIVRKKISKSKDSKLKSQVRWIIKNHGEHVPKIISHGSGLFNYYYDMPYYDKHHNFKDYIRVESIENSSKILDRLLKFLFREVYFYIPEKEENISKKLDLYIEKKFIEKIKDVAKLNPAISKLINFNYVYINGKKYRNIPEIMAELKKIRPFIVKNSHMMATNLHGDVTVENILCQKDSFILLDPNDENSFNSRLIDLGKLFQSLHSNYEFLKQIKSCNIQGNKIEFAEPRDEKYGQLYNLLLNKLDVFVSKNEKRLIFFHEAMHYSRMLPYKQKINKKTVPVYYAIMIKRFNDFIDYDKTNNI